MVVVGTAMAKFLAQIHHTSFHTRILVAEGNNYIGNMMNWRFASGFELLLLLEPEFLFSP